MVAILKDPSVKVLCNAIDDLRLGIDQAYDANAQCAVPALTAALNVLVGGLDQVVAERARAAAPLETRNGSHQCI